MTELVLIDEKGGGCWRMWPSPEAPPCGAVRELGNYVLELRGCPDGAGQADLLLNDVFLEALRPKTLDSARWRWSPGFHAGTAQAELRIPGCAPRRFEIVTDADLRKLTRDDFDTMVGDIMEDTFALFSLSIYP